MNLQHERIAALCEELKLVRAPLDWPALAQETAGADGSFADFLERLLGAEARARQERKVAVLMKLATMPGIKTLEQFDWAQAPGAPKAGWRQLSWPVDDNYLGRSGPDAGQVREVGSTVRHRSDRGRTDARQEDHGPPGAQVQGRAA